MPQNLMDGIFSEMNRVREIVKDYEALPNNAGVFASHMMKFDINEAEYAIKENDVTKMIQCYSNLKETK